MCSDEMLTLIGVIKAVLRLVEIMIPILLIALGIFDLASAVVAQDEKAQSAALKKFGKRLGYAIGVFLVVFVVQFVMKFVSNSAGSSNGGGLGADNATSFIECWNKAS